MPDWRSIPKIDAHIHLLPPDVIAANQGYGDRFVDFGSAEEYLAREYGLTPARRMRLRRMYLE